MLTDEAATKLRDQLVREIEKRNPRIRRLERYREGRHDMPAGLAQASEGRTAELRRVFESLLKESRSNWCGLVVDAVDERLAVDGFRFKGETKPATDVWEIWQANQFDAQALLVHGCALATGQAYVTVWPGPTASDYPVITPEHPCEVIVAYEAGTGRRYAALKVWRDEDGYHNVNLFTRDAVWKWRSIRPESGFTRQYRAGESITGHITWVPREVPDEDWPLPNQLGEVSVVEYAANPRLAPRPFGGGVAEFEEAVEIQDRINETVFGRLLAMHFSAFRQKWATGLSVPKDEHGNPIEPFNASLQKLWIAPNPESRFGDFSEHNLENYLKAAEADVQHLAAITHTPPHYLLGQMVNIPAEGMRVAETGLISKVRRHQRFFGESHEDVARLAIKAHRLDDPRADDVTCEVVWRDPETRSDAERVDALVKLATIGVPRRALWERIPGVTQTELDRWETLAGEEAARQALATITTSVPQESGATVNVGGGR